MNRRLLTTMTATLATVFLLTGPSSADEACGFTIPDCATVDLQKRSVDIDNDCGHPITIEVTVTDGMGSGFARIPQDYGSLHIGPPYDTEAGKTAYYSEASCCVGTIDNKNYTCD